MIQFDYLNLPKLSVEYSFSSWWFQIFVIFIPILGEDEPILTCAYFSNGLKSPTSLGCVSDVLLMTLEVIHES